MPDRRRISTSEAIDLYRHSSLCELTMQAAEVARRLHPSNVRTYVVERNINYTNVCASRCSFCAFSVSPGSDGAYVLTTEQIDAKIDELLEVGGTQILLQGGMNPLLPLDWYERLLRHIRQRFTRLHIHAFSPPEIVFLSEQFDLTVSEVLRRLQHAGLDSLPGAGAEILVDRVRRIISPAKCSAAQWLDVMRQAHLLGMCSTATMMFGHVETLAERIEHLESIRSLQDESLRRQRQDPSTGCFTAFTCWPFQPGRTRLHRSVDYDPGNCPDRQPSQPCPAHAVEQLKMTAIARLYLDNIPNIQASWVTQGPQIAQLSLLTGCNDIGSLMLEENVVAATGLGFHLTVSQVQQLIERADFIPRQRDYYYNHLPAPAARAATPSK